MLQHQCLFKVDVLQNIIIFKVVHVKSSSHPLSGFIYMLMFNPEWVMVLITATKLVEYLAIR